MNCALLIPQYHITTTCGHMWYVALAQKNTTPHHVSVYTRGVVVWAWENSYGVARKNLHERQTRKKLQHGKMNGARLGTRLLLLWHRIYDNVVNNSGILGMTTYLITTSFIHRFGETRIANPI